MTVYAKFTCQLPLCMQVLSTYNIKGGVGKTATAVNLAAVSAHQGYRTLVWDLDPQGAASFFFRITSTLKGGGERLLRKDTDLQRHIKRTEYEGLDILPSDFSTRHFDLVLEGVNRPSKRLLRLLDPLEEVYDVVILDCPPSASRLSEAILGASHALLVPVIPTTLCLRTLEQIYVFRDSHTLGACRILPFFSMVDLRKRLHREILDVLPKARPGMLRTKVPASTEVERMGITQKPLPIDSPSGVMAKVYFDLWQEIVHCLDPLEFSQAKPGIKIG